MRGWLIYDRQGAARNEWFINRMIKYAKIRNVDLELKFPQDCRHKPDFACVRTIAPTINKDFEKNSVRVFNNALTSEIANDKYKTFLLARSLKIPVMQTEILSERTIDFPFVLKTVDGHGGNEVFCVDSELRLKEYENALKDKKLIVQPFCSDVGTDVRVYVLGGKIIGAVKRVGESFKSNFSLGGRAEKFEPTETQKEITRILYEKLKFDFAGVDFILNDGEWTLNEIEDAVGSRMLYATYNTDVAKLYVNHVIDVLRG